MRLATVSQSRRIDERTQEECGVGDELLMEDAASATVHTLKSTYPFELRKGPVWIFCGPGNNGGDGMAVARLLFCSGLKNIRVILSGETNLSGRKQLDRIRKLGLSIERTVPAREKPSLVIDAVFGIGLSRKVEGEMESSIEIINSFRQIPVVSLDVPSGLNVNTGWAMGMAVKASLTLTFGFAKPGFFMREGPEKVGRLRILPLSFSPSIVKEETGTHFLFSVREARKLLPKRSNWSNKSTHGRLQVLAGSEGKWGAAHLASEAGFRVGSGYVTVVSHDASAPLVTRIPEVMTLSGDKFKPDPRMAYAVGPGMGINDQTTRMIEALCNSACDKVVLDADALSVWAQKKPGPLPPSWLVTPHSGELARLLGISAADVEADVFAAAQKAHHQLGCNILVKGFHTVLVRRDKFLIIPSGNSSLAKAGTGDVLTGMIGGLMAQGLTPLVAGALAAFIHGAIADAWVRDGNDKRSLTASDLCARLPRILNDLSAGILGETFQT